MLVLKNLRIWFHAFVPSEKKVRDSRDYVTVALQVMKVITKAGYYARKNCLNIDKE